MGLDNYGPNMSMETIFMNTEKSKNNEPQKLVVTNIKFKKFKQTFCSSKLVYLLHLEKYVTTAQKQKQ